MDFEKAIIGKATEAINKSIVDNLTGYNSPLQKMVKDVIKEHEENLYKLINDEFSTLINAETFREQLKQSLNEKLAKTLINRMGGELESKVNELKANPVTRAKITSAIANVMEEL